MWIRKARVDGFGRIAEREFEFARGLNCIHGPNESGKTTLVSFLSAMLYGLARPGKERRYLEEAHERYRPWRAPLYSGEVTVGLGAGRIVNVRRDFRDDAGGIEIADGVSGRSLLQDYQRDRHREYRFAETHTGVDKRLFRAVFVIGHRQHERVSHDETRLLADRVMALAQTGNEALSAEGAQNALKKLFEAIGSDGAPTKPFRKTLEALGRCRDRLERAQNSQRECADEMLRRAQLDKQVTAAREQMEEKGRLLSHSVAAHLAALEQEADNLRARADSEEARTAPENLRDLDPEKLVIVERQVAEFVHTREVFSDMQRRLSEITAAVESGRKSLHESAKTIQAISKDGRDFLAAAGDRKSELLEQLTRKKQRLSKANRLRWGRRLSIGLAVALLAAGAAAAAVIFLFAAATFKTVFSALAFVVPAAAAIILLVRAARLAARSAEFADAEKDYRQLSERLLTHDRKLGEILSAFGGQSRQEVLEAVEEFDGQARQVEEAEGDRSALEAKVARERPALENACQGAAEALARAGLAMSGSLSRSVQAVFDGRPAEAEPHEEPTGALGDVRSRTDVAAAFRPLYDKARELAESRARLTEAHSTLARLESRKQALLAGRSREETLRLVEGTEPPEDAAELAEDEIPQARLEIDRARQCLGSLELELAQVSGRLEEGLKDLPEIAALEERISVLEGRHDIQSFYRAALDESIRVIDEAATAFHRRIFPRLEGSLNALLAGVTLGAHEEVRLWVDEQEVGSPLRFSVKDDLKESPVAPEALSQGACEQLYLCARLALAEALSGDEPAPVMLDDPFINYDPERLRGALEVLGEVAGRRQVFLFTCQRDVRDLAVECGAGIVEL